MRRAAVFEELAKSQKNIVVSGETGEQLLAQLINMTVDGDNNRKIVAKK